MCRRGWVVRIRQITIENFRGIRRFVIQPGLRNVIIGPNNACKSTVLEALDLLLHSGIGRPRPAPTELDYYGREVALGFSVEAVLGELSKGFLAEVHEHLEGWVSAAKEVVPEPQGDGIEPVVRVSVTGTPDLDLVHEFAKPESRGASFSRRHRIMLGWVFDGRTRDPGRQLAFYQGGVLERLFVSEELDPAVASLRTALDNGAGQVNADTAVDKALRGLAKHLHDLGLLPETQVPAFELGGVTRRELLQTLRLGLPFGKVTIPLDRQGRGAQRLVLLSVLLGLASTRHEAPILGIEEPEEALEPVRQFQVARMVAGVTDSGGQCFVVTHSPEIARAFCLDDFIIMSEGAAGEDARQMRGRATSKTRQYFERRIHGPIVRALFARVPVLVEGPSDVPVFEVFWDALARESKVPVREHVGLDVIDCEGASRQPGVAEILCQAGKPVVAWAELDQPENLARLRSEGNCGVIILHDEDPDRFKLEAALAQGASLPALAAGMTAVAEDREYSWEEQRIDLVQRCGEMTAEERDALKLSGNLTELLALLAEPRARQLIQAALESGGVTPFEIKGARPARLFAEKLVESGPVPANFAQVMQELGVWILQGCAGACEFSMRRDQPTP
jgi:putative ATP-dependent endonuclease of the OLD family